MFNICKRHKEIGAKALRDAPGGRRSGQGRMLDAAQELLVRQLIADKTPDQLKMPYALWSRAAVAQLVEQCFGIRLAVRTVGLYLSRWGFTPQKPMKKACEQSPAAEALCRDPVDAGGAREQRELAHGGLGHAQRAADLRVGESCLQVQAKNVSYLAHRDPWRGHWQRTAKGGQPMPTVRSLACALIVHDQRETPSTII